jgi:predicted nucleotidyltransferase
MTRDDVLARLRAREPQLRSLGLGKLYLFGSVARGEANSKDVDLLFEIGDSPHFTLLDQAGALIALEEILGSPVDLVERKMLHRRIRPKVEADLVEIF